VGLNPGNDTVTFTNPAIVADRLHAVTAVGATSFTQTGCNMQPISVGDRISDTEYSEATDKCICPPSANIQTVQSEWTATFTGQKFRVLGVKPYRDSPWGRLDHITIMCKEERG